MRDRLVWPGHSSHEHLEFLEGGIRVDHLEEVEFLQTSIIYDLVLTFAAADAPPR